MSTSAQVVSEKGLTRCHGSRRRMSEPVEELAQTVDVVRVKEGKPYAATERDNLQAIAA